MPAKGYDSYDFYGGRDGAPPGGVDASRASSSSKSTSNIASFLKAMLPQDHPTAHTLHGFEPDLPDTMLVPTAFVARGHTWISKGFSSLWSFPVTVRIWVVLLFVMLFVNAGIVSVIADRISSGYDSNERVAMIYFNTVVYFLHECRLFRVATKILLHLSLLIALLSLALAFRVVTTHLRRSTGGLAVPMPLAVPLVAPHSSTSPSSASTASSLSLSGGSVVAADAFLPAQTNAAGPGDGDEAYARALAFAQLQGAGREEDIFADWPAVQRVVLRQSSLLHVVAALAVVLSFWVLVPPLIALHFQTEAAPRAFLSASAAAATAAASSSSAASAAAGDAETDPEMAAALAAAEAADAAAAASEGGGYGGYGSGGGDAATGGRVFQPGAGCFAADPHLSSYAFALKTLWQRALVVGAAAFLPSLALRVVYIFWLATLAKSSVVLFFFFTGLFCALHAYVEYV